MGYDVRIDRESGRHLAVSSFEASPDEMGQHQPAAFGAVAGYLGRIGIPITGPAVSRYEPAEGGRFRVSSGFVVEGDFATGDGVEHQRLPECEVGRTVHVGRYEKLGEAYDALRRGVREAGREVEESGTMWEEYLTGPETPPDQTRTVVSWPLRAEAAAGGST
jgi:effector-binding domain-containing protein